MDHSLENSYEQLALKEAILQKRIQLLIDERHIVLAEMEYVRKFSLPEQQKVISEPSSSKNKSEASPEQTATGKGSTNPLTPVDLVKIQNEDHTSQQMVISSPSSEMNKDEANPKQTALGKEISNPLKAVALPKSKTEDQTSITLVRPSDLNLRPNGGIPIPNKPEGQTSANAGYKSYYVVYNGPNAGIYTTWAIAEKAVSGFSGVKHKKFKTFDEAKISASLFTTSQFKPPLELICSSEGLKPTYAKSLAKIQGSKKIIGIIPKDQRKIFVENTDDVFDTTYSMFRYLYVKGRNTTEKDFVEEHYFTTDKANISYFNFYPSAHPEFVYEAYQYGLLSMVYPSNNLLEISKFPQEFRDSVKTYKKKCLKGVDKEIYLKIQSTNIFWDRDENYDDPIQPYHYAQIGVIKEKVYSPSTAMEAKLEQDDLKEHAVHRLSVLIDKVFSIQRDDKIKVNLVTPYLLITSFSHKGMDEDDYEKVVAYRAKLVHPHVFERHDSLVCQSIDKVLKKFGTTNNCSRCKGPTTKDKEKVVEEE